MGLLSGILGAAAPIVGGIFGGQAGAAIGGALGSAFGGGAKQSGSQTATQQQQIDPRLANILFGENGSTGFLSQLASEANRPQSEGQRYFNQGIDQYLGGWGTDSFMRSQQAAQALQDQQRQAPMVGWSGDAGNISASQVNAPGQNNLNLSPAFQNFIYGNAAENPYLQRSLQAGVDLNNAGYRSNVQNLTDTLQRQVLPGIRGNAIASGQYGGSRQGIAEGNAISDFTKQLTNANLQQNLAQTQGVLGAQSDVFNRGQDRSLSALQGLSGQQYGVASQNAQLAQQAALANQQNAQQNANRNLARDTTNQSAILQTNQQNDSRNLAGANLSSNLLNQAFNYSNQGNNASLNRLSQIGGVLSPFTNVNSTSTSSQPLYTNPGANLLGGLTAGLGLYNQFKGIGGGSSGSSGGSIGSSLAGMFPGGY